MHGIRVVGGDGEFSFVGRYFERRDADRSGLTDLQAIGIDHTACSRKIDDGSLLGTSAEIETRARDGRELGVLGGFTIFVNELEIGGIARVAILPAHVLRERARGE